MYINKIDELLDKIFDNFYSDVVSQKNFSKFINELNFVKYQRELNEILTAFSKKIPEKQIFEIIKNQDNVLVIVETIKRYICYYLFLTLGFFYKGKFETFINNIIEFTKIQPTFSYHVDNFFNSENNSIMIKMAENITLLKNLLAADANKQKILASKKEYADVINFISSFDRDFVISNFKLENLKGKEQEQAHNIIKTMIIKNLYLDQDKKDIYLILESAEKEKGIYTFIEIVVPREQVLDLSQIEAVLTPNEVTRGMAYDIMNLINDYEEMLKKRELTIEKKINVVLNSGALIPISDDFLLYHKDSEKYEKQTHGKVGKKKDDTKIRYIVGKIDAASDLYSESTKKNPTALKEVEKNFYQPLAERKVVIRNDIEEIGIINKLMNQGRKAIESNEYYNDLINYRVYPYINFKDFKNYGFSINTEKTLDVVRYAGFEKTVPGRHLVQLRVSNYPHNLNIVGFIIPPTVMPIQCITMNNTVDIRSLAYGKENSKKKFENGYEGALKFIKHTLFKNKKLQQAIYWMLDPTKDKIKLETYTQKSKVNVNEDLKIVVSRLYDDLLAMMYGKIVSQLDKQKNITYQQFKRIVKNVENKLFNIPENSDIMNLVETYFIKNKIVTIEPKYDIKEDNFPGLYGNYIKLIEPPKTGEKPLPIAKINLMEHHQKKTVHEVGPESEGAICQHLLTWEKLTAMRKKNPNEFIKYLFEFVLQYVEPNYENDYVCKSCSSIIDIKNYMQDGSFDDDGRFIMLSVQLDLILEDMPEYQRYDKAVKNIDKMVDRLATVSKVYFLLEKSARQRNPIKTMLVKNTIDLLIIHNKIMGSRYKDRKEKITQQYGIPKELSNFFVFPLDNSIFVYSSKDKDYYKPIKRNNILAYIFFLMIIELNESQIVYLTGDKTCNYYLFAKYGYQMFNNIKIRKNNKNVIAPIQNYKVLCYLIFYISCMIVQYGMWQTEELEETKKKKVDPVMQKVIIYTLVDLINSVIEIYSSVKNRNQLYDTVSVKFFQKLSTVFKDNDLLKKLKDIEDRKVVVEGTVKKFKSTSVKSVPLDDGFSYPNYLDIPNWTKCLGAKEFIRSRDFVYPRYNYISPVTNCPDGQIHQWTVQKTDVVCNLCNSKLSEVKPDADESEQIVKNYKRMMIRKNAKKYCAKGELHKFIFDKKASCSVCSKCKYKEGAELTNEQIDELEKMISKSIEYRDEKDIEKEKAIEIRQKKKDEHIQKVISEYKALYSKSKSHKEDYLRFVDTLIHKLEQTVGKNTNINAQNIYLDQNIYIIDHDHNGYQSEPIVISEKDNKIVFRKDHPYFKKDVLFYNNQKLGIEVFYDSITYLLIGYKEKNKEYEKPKMNAFLKISYSIANRLKLLGYPSKYINITDYVKEARETYKIEEPQKIVNYVVSEISHMRIQNLKKSITDIQRYIYRSKYNYEQPKTETVKTGFIDEEEPTDIFLEKYKNKLIKMKVKNNDDKFMDDWKVFKYKVSFMNVDDKAINLSADAEYIITDDLVDYDYHGNLILFYIVAQLEKLIDMNVDKYLKLTISFLITDIIIELYGLYDQEKLQTNYEIKRFQYLLSNSGYMYDVEEKGHGLEGETEGFYGEYKDPDEPENEEDIEAKEDAQEEMEALDVDTEIDYEVDYHPDYNFSG